LQDFHVPVYPREIRFVVFPEMNVAVYDHRGQSEKLKVKSEKLL
jgi:hypothetical protein